MAFVSVDYQREAFVFRMPDGLPVYIHYSFLFLALLIAAPLWFQGRLSSSVIAAALAVILLLSILAHELGHVVAARAQQARARSIEIGLFGGLANLQWDFHRGLAPRQVALAGPAVNLGLAAGFFALYWLATRYGAADVQRSVVPFEAPAILAGTLLLAGILNLGLGLLNLLPAFPLDGGTIAQDVLSGRLGDRRATLIVGVSGLVLTCIGAVVALMMLLAGTPVFAPLSFRQNWRAILDNWRGGPRQPPKTTAFAKSSKVATFRPVQETRRKPVIHVIAIITAKPGQRAAILANFAANRPAVLAEAGCIEYGAAIDVENMGTAAYGPDTFVVIEKWESEDALKTHAAAPHMKAYGEKNKDLIAGRAIHVLKPV